jgi:hypothetical protein
MVSVRFSAVTTTSCSVPVLDALEGLALVDDCCARDGGAVSVTTAASRMAETPTPAASRADLAEHLNMTHPPI